MGLARAAADLRGERSAWQVQQIVAFGIFSSYVEFAYLIAGDMNAPIFLFLQILWRSSYPIFYNTESTFYMFVKVWFFWFFRTLLGHMLFFGRQVLGPLGTFSDTLIKNARFWKFNIIDNFTAVFLTFWDFSVLSLRRRCIDVLTLIAGYANPLRSKILFWQSGVLALAPC